MICGLRTFCNAYVGLRRALLFFTLGGRVISRAATGDGGMDRRDFILTSVVAAAGMTIPGAWLQFDEGARMYGLIGKMIAVDGRRDELIAGVAGERGWWSYIGAKDEEDDKRGWITGGWEGREQEQADTSRTSERE